MRPFVPSTNVAHLRQSATIAVSAQTAIRRAQGRPVIDLGPGEPDFPTPNFVVEAAQRALAAGETRYTPVPGIAPLRDAIAARCNDDSPGVDVQRDGVVVSTGSKQALFNACYVLFGPGDEVLIPTPAWTSYCEIIALAGATAVEVWGPQAAGIRVTPADLRASATPRTRGLIINSPCNPTGAVYSTAELAAIVGLADERGWWIVSDEIYRAITYEGRAASILDVASSLDRVVVVDGLAKSLAMTGWRLGWSVSTPEVAAAITALQSHTTSNANSITQHAAVAALTEREHARRAIAAMLFAYRERRDAALDLFRHAGMTLTDPAGAFYFFIRVCSATPDQPDPGSAFAAALLDEADVAVVPGAAFHAPEWIRMSYAAPRDQVLEGVRRVIERLPGVRAADTSPG